MYKITYLCLLIACALNGVTTKTGSSHVFTDTRQEIDGLPDWDPNGYIIFCLCMGRTGNQFEHFLGGIAFAKKLNRTLILPPFRTYRNIRFTEWFKLESIAQYHRVILAEDFMQYFAPTHWPEQDRVGMCFAFGNLEHSKCEMKTGNPFGPFWDGLGVDFAKTENFYLSYMDPVLRWEKRFPVDKYPVLALRGAPAPFPMKRQHRDLQRYLQVSDFIESEAQGFIDANFPNTRFIGIHLRNGADWQVSCHHGEGKASYMASPQCLDDTTRVITKDMCLPSDHEVFRLLGNVLEETGITTVLVATDQYPLKDEIEQRFSHLKVRVYHADPHLPLVDMTLLVKSDHFIGNCVSSFTSYVKRARDVAQKPTSFWGFS